jgi:hypothetical protein
VRRRRKEGGRERERERWENENMRICCVGHHQEQYIRDAPCLVIYADIRPASANILEVWRPHLEE